MIEFRVGPRRELVVSRSVQKFVELLDNDLSMRRMFLSRLVDSLLEREKEEERPRLAETIVTIELLPHPRLGEKIKEAREKLKGKHSPLHGLLSIYEVICDSLEKRISKCQLDMNALARSMREKHLLKEVHFSLCPKICFLKMSSKPTPHCEICGEKTIIFSFYRVDKELLMAWRDNIFFEAWIFSLLKRNGIKCESNPVIFYKDQELGEIDILIRNGDKKCIIEVTKGRGITDLGRKMLANNEILGGGYKLIMLHRIEYLVHSKKCLKIKLSFWIELFQTKDFQKDLSTL